jgi:hypothetical protein
MEGMGIEQMVLFRRALNTADAGYWAAKRGSQEITPALNQMHRAVSELQAAFDKDISGFIAKNASDRPAVQALRTLADANKDHTKFWKLQHEVEQTTLANTLGINAGIDPEQTLLQIARMEPRQQRELAMVLQAQSPGALADLRLLLVNNAVQDAVSGSTRAARHGLVDPEAFGKAILDKHGNVFGSEIFTPAQYAQLQRGLSTIRVLKDGAFGTENVNRALSLEGTGMAGASGSVAFLTRAMIRIFGLGRAEELLFTKEGLRSLEVLRNSSKEPPQAISKALAKIIDLAALNPERPDPYLDTSE